MLDNTNHIVPASDYLYEAVLPIQQQLVLVAVVTQGHAPLDAHPRPHAAHHVVGLDGQHLLPGAEVDVEVVDRPGQPRAGGQQPQVPGGRQAVTRVPALKSVVPEQSMSFIYTIYITYSKQYE